jgi:Flp pilus assembly protein TadG
MKNMLAGVRRPTRRRGNAIVEFALSFSMLWVILGGVFQFGYTIYLYEGLANAVQNAAAFASRADFVVGTSTFSDQVKNMVVYGSPIAGSTPLVPNLTTAKVSVTWTSDSAGLPLTVTVRIVNYTVAAVFNTFTFTNKPLCTMRYAGRYQT